MAGLGLLNSEALLYLPYYSIYSVHSIVGYRERRSSPDSLKVKFCWGDEADSDGKLNDTARLHCWRD